MWKVKYINTKTKLIEWRTYNCMEENQVRAIANNMKGLVWLSMSKEY